VTPDARVLRFPSATAGTDARDYGRFTRELSPDELAGCFFFSDDDRGRIATRRGDGSRLGFAVQLGTVRYLGRFLENPADVPATVLGWTIRELGVRADTSLEGYGEGEARWEHQAEIRRVYGYRPFGDEGVEEGLEVWLRARAWVSAESHRVLFTRAAGHLTARRILLPGYSTLWRLVGSACEHADARGFEMLAGTPTSEQRDRLAALLQTPAGRRLSVLERLRRPEVEPTIGGLISGLARVQELRELADGLASLDALPVARLRALMVDAERCRAADIAKMSDARRIATLMAFAITATERGQDDALELFDRLHGELLLRVRAQSARERLADGEALDHAGRTLMDACRIVLDDSVTEPLREAVFAAVARDELTDAVGAMARLARSPDDRARELVLSRYRGVRRYLPALLDTITFLANDAGEPILAALDGLRQAAGQRTLTPQRLSTGFVSRPWRTLVEPRPGEIDRAAYTMCALEACATRCADATSMSPRASATLTRAQACSATRHGTPHARTPGDRCRCPRSRAPSSSSSAASSTTPTGAPATG